jgi:hypothetical protein
VGIFLGHIYLIVVINQFEFVPAYISVVVCTKEVLTCGKQYTENSVLHFYTTPNIFLIIQ